ncbi:undecaprenyldiphospho-muramoylpentapeptide beta-N-acetylglucosaminyltransferase [Anaerosphaera multitolerans]|uniref:UDP-N-acetylglucosamine--N-acetylmuramyl-(pentapeptide) pyrophosphoryl-undecaprenol N-acetylglucosamine transferase n=1 Tax=Anaerosphaera multitolerans TaxID=2487351 RepID=A0A437S6Y5_9FIRM|nr:undecaprenyldiphospho-muramoylpentapeptide beta-N-acetylglucosaminyltransferase [Anaerosphaera multitolerans]RVU54776.1 undecaprenyldiphospho-muramoylpentapeptide beta-N-acetylglucosaminyltransferase [Anaerosphaera multitolerans]
MKYILSGGGTGGHIYPALAIAKEIKNRDSNNEILYIGKKNSLEEELVTKEGYDFKPIHIEGLPRKKISFKTIKTMWTLLRGIGESSSIIKDFDPDVVIGTGGYVCGPVLFVAQKKKIKTVVQEQNAFPGKTNKILSKKADLVALNFKEAEKYLDSENMIITGNPIRDDFNYLDREKSAQKLGSDLKGKTVLSFGGSGGQESTNDAVIGMIKAKLDFNFNFIHITGKEHYDYFMDSIKGIELPENIKIVDYSYEIPDILTISDLVIASSSAMTLAEISAVGVASILIPKSYTAGNHQYFNAKSYEEKGASRIILEKDLTSEELYGNIIEILNNDEERLSMAKASKELGNIDAVKILVDEIEGLIQ